MTKPATEPTPFTQKSLQSRLPNIAPHIRLFNFLLQFIRPIQPRLVMADNITPDFLIADRGIPSVVNTISGTQDPDLYACLYCSAQNYSTPQTARWSEWWVKVPPFREKNSFGTVLQCTYLSRNPYFYIVTAALYGTAVKFS